MLSNKLQLRKELKAKRNSLTPNEKSSFSDAIVKNLLEIFANNKCVDIYGFYPTELEPDISGIFLPNFNVYLPACMEGREMQFYIVRDFTELKPGKWGIYEPITSSPVGVPSKNSALIVPGLAFTKNGNRLGLGLGYYDDFISRNPFPLKIGTCFDEFVLDDLPLESHDQGVDIVVTEKRVIYRLD